LLTRTQKEEIVKNLREKFGKCEAVFVTTFHKFTAHESNEIRKILREKSAEFRVVKNTLIRIASQKTNYEKVVDFIEGPTALVLAYQDPVEIAKILKKFLDEHDSLKLRGFVIEGKGFGVESFEELAKLPPKEILLAQLLGTIQAPIAQFVGVLSAILRNFLYVLKAIEEKKAKEGA
jgi:large subunit ribosomal protein L10